MTKKIILLIDDDKELSELLSDYLSGEGYEVVSCFDGVSGLKAAKEKCFDLILLDVMLPEMNGFEVLKALGSNFQTPILMLTAKGDETDKVLGLELGADDYLAKPYHHRELLARINAILRRFDKLKNNGSTEEVEINNVRLNHASRQVFCAEQEVVLTGTEYQILTELMNNVGHIVSKEHISLTVLSRRLAPFDRAIDMHISNIRRKLQQAEHKNQYKNKIKTIRGVGYIFLSDHDE